MSRTARIERKTAETQVTLMLDLDQEGRWDIQTGIGFFDHMLAQVARHGLIDLTIRCSGDLHVDTHHTVEDVAICLGMALRQALGDKRGITRYGHSFVPLDEALARVVVDLGGRQALVFQATFSASQIGTFATETVQEFFKAFADHAGANVHVTLLHGINAHHQVECIFKAFARALRQAVTIDPRSQDVPSTKGQL